MKIDEFLAQPLAAVRDDGFSQRLTLTLYRRRLYLRNMASAAGLGVLLLALIVLPIAGFVQKLALQLTAVMTLPFIPWLAAAAAILLLVIQPRLLRF